MYFYLHQFKINYLLATVNVGKLRRPGQVNARSKINRVNNSVVNSKKEIKSTFITIGEKLTLFFFNLILQKNALFNPVRSTQI